MARKSRWSHVSWHMESCLMAFILFATHVSLCSCLRAHLFCGSHVSGESRRTEYADGTHVSWESCLMGVMSYGVYRWHIWHIWHACLVAFLLCGTLVSVESCLMALMYCVMGVMILHHGILVSWESCLMGVSSHKINESWGKSRCDSLLQDICNGARMHLRNTCSIRTGKKFAMG